MTCVNVKYYLNTLSFIEEIDLKELVLLQYWILQNVVIWMHCLSYIREKIFKSIWSDPFNQHKPAIKSV